jgi:hypothetical protein
VAPQHAGPARRLQRKLLDEGTFPGTGFATHKRDFARAGCYLTQVLG